MKRTCSAGFTLVELLVVIAIIGVLIAAAIPAVQASRETARRASCTAHVAHLMLAIQDYEDGFETLPAGVKNPDGPIRSEPNGEHQGWLLQLLPYLDERSLYKAIDFSKSVYDPANERVRELMPHLFRCPSSAGTQRTVSDYAGCHHDAEAPIAADNQGVLFLNSQVRRDEITDGASYTLFVGEKLAEVDDLGWMSGTRATLRNTGTLLNEPPPGELTLLYVGGFGSSHPNGANIGLGDGSVKFVDDTIDVEVWHRLGNRSDGELIDLRRLD